MPSCGDDLRLYDPQVQTCEFSPSSDSDVHNNWYYPFNADGSGMGHSAAYKIDVTAGAPTPTTISRDVFSNLPPTVTCAANARSKPMCVKVQGPEFGGVKTQLADPVGAGILPGDLSDGAVYTVNNCNRDDQRWIESATAFAPPGDPQGRTTYEVRGCALDCTEPNFADLNMTKLSGDNPSSGGDFSVQFKCASGYGPPLQVSPAVITAAERGNMVGDTGMPATKCAVDGGPYGLNYTDGQGNDVPALPCVQDCTLPAQTDSYRGYDLAATMTNLGDNNINLGLALDESLVSGHLTCAPNYTLQPGDAVTACGVGGGPIVINDETTVGSQNGCVADCNADPKSKAFNWLPNGDLVPEDSSTHNFHAFTDLFIWRDPAQARAGFPELSSSSSGIGESFSCPSGYEAGPGSGAGGEPLYESCGYLPGNTKSMSAYSIFTRSTYGLTGCYPECDAANELCYNYTAEREYNVGPGSFETAQPEATWRDEMGQMLTDATTGASSAQSPLGASNISFVRRQVLNNGSDVNMGKEIFEWQIKCSNQTCTNDPAESDKININDILGPDGIPTPVIPGDPGFYFADDGQSCDAACSVKQNLTCDPNFTMSDIVEPNSDTTPALAFASLVSSSDIGSGNQATCMNGEVFPAEVADNAAAPYFVYNAANSSCLAPINPDATISCSSTISNPDLTRSYETHNRLCKCV
jgi:hypothetical protein